MILPMFSLFDEINQKYVLTKGKTMNLFDSKNKSFSLQFDGSNKVIVHFWATTCEPCIEEFDSIQKYVDVSKTEIYLISVEDSVTVNRFLEREKWNLPFYTTDGMKLPFKPNKIEIYPTTFIIKDDSIIDSAVGPITWSEFKINN